MRKDLENIIVKLRKEFPRLQTQFKVSSLEIFGSFVRGEQKENSDLDVLVTFSDPPSLFTFIELEDYLSNLLGIKVDLVMKSALKANIKQRILSESLSINRKIGLNG